MRLLRLLSILGFITLASLALTVNGVVLTVPDGGTGLSSFTVGDIMYASATTTLSKLSDIATGNVLISGGISTAPSYGKVGLTTHISGTLPTANGGTGQTTYTNGQLLIGSTGSGSLSKATLTAGMGIAVTNGAGSVTVAVSQPIWLFREDYTSTAKPGNSIAGTSDRILNNALLSGGGDVSLNTGTGVFTMTAGTYLIEATVPGYGCGIHRSILYGVTVSGDYDYGTIEVSAAGTQERSKMKTQITISGTEDFKIKHKTENAVTDGLGIPATGGGWSDRTYTEITIVKIQ